MKLELGNEVILSVYGLNSEKIMLNLESHESFRRQNRNTSLDTSVVFTSAMFDSDLVFIQRRVKDATNGEPGLNMAAVSTSSFA